MVPVRQRRESVFNQRLREFHDSLDANRYVMDWREFSINPEKTRRIYADKLREYWLEQMGRIRELSEPKQPNLNCRSLI